MVAVPPNNSFIAASIEYIEATKLAGWNFPKNWDRVCGYTGTGPFVAFYSEKDKLVWMDGHLYGSSTDTRLFFKDAVAYIHQRVGEAVQALGSDNRYPFGSLVPEVTAVFCLLIDRKDFSAWVARIPVAKEFLRQFPVQSVIRFPSYPPSILTQPCFNCTQGWRLDVNYEYTLCPECRGTKVVPILDN
jgi:hypothetical protein